MKKSILLLLAGALVSSAIAKPLTIEANDNLRKVLISQKDKRVTLRLKSGQSITGQIGLINKDIVHVKRLQGMEFYDSITSVDSIESVVIRTKD